MFILITVISFFLLIITEFYNYYKNEKYLNWIKGPRPWPLIGNTLEFASGDVLHELCRMHKKYGSIFKLSFDFLPPTIVITEQKFLEFVFRSSNLLKKSNDYRFLHSWLGHGLLTAPGERWRKHRKLIAPAFHFDKLQCFIETFEKYSSILVGKLYENIGEGTVNIYPYIKLCTLDIICEATMGTRINAQQDSKSDYVVSVAEMCRIIVDRSVHVFKAFDCLYQFTKDYWIQKKAIQILHEYSENIIKLRSNEHSKKAIHKNTLLDLLLDSKELGENITEKEIREEVDTFIFAGHDTVASAITFTLYCLAKHQQVQDEVVDELSSLLWSNKIESRTYSDFQNLKYLDAVIKESLRLYPPVPIYSRNTEENKCYGDHVIPANTNIVIFAYEVHRCPKTFPDPDRFDPSRFYTENQSIRPACSYIPFSAGYRNCIGQKFALLEIKVLISKILSCYRLLPATPEHKIQLRAETVLLSKNGVYIKLEKR